MNMYKALREITLPQIVKEKIPHVNRIHSGVILCDVLHVHALVINVYIALHSMMNCISQ